MYTHTHNGCTHTHTHTHTHTCTHTNTYTHVIHTTHTHTHTHTRHTHKHTYSHTHTQPYAIKGWVSRQSQSKFSHQLLTSHSELVAHTVCSLWTLLVPLQWEEFLKLGDEVETKCGGGEDQVSATRALCPAYLHCELWQPAGHQIAIKCKG